MIVTTIADNHLLSGVHHAFDPMRANRFAKGFSEEQTLILGRLDANCQGQFPLAKISGVLWRVRIIKMLVSCLELAEKFVRIVRRADVDNDDLEVGIILFQDQGQGLSEMLSLVAGADDNRDGWPCDFCFRFRFCR